MLTIEERLGGEQYRLNRMKENAKTEIRVSMPAMITGVNYNEMTISAQPCIKEKLRTDGGELDDVSFPIIEDIPLVFPSSNKYCITFPVSIGDECLLIFSDLCIDSWWQSGGIQTQYEYRRHDLSDCFAIPSQMSQAKKINNFNGNYLEIKNNATGVKIEVMDNTVKVAGVDIVAMKLAFDNLVSAHNQLRSEYDALKQDYDVHTHSVTVPDATIGVDVLSGSTGGPL